MKSCSLFMFASSARFNDSSASWQSSTTRSTLRCQAATASSCCRSASGKAGSRRAVRSSRRSWRGSTLPLALITTPAAGPSSPCITASCLLAEVNDVQASASSDAMPRAWVAASWNSEAVFPMNSLVTPALTPSHRAFSAFAFMPVRASSASFSSRAAMVSQSSAAFLSLLTGAFITSSNVSMLDPPGERLAAARQGRACGASTYPGRCSATYACAISGQAFRRG